MNNPTQAQIDKLTVKTESGYLAELKAYNSLGTWQTGYSYLVNDVVSESDVLYVCLKVDTQGAKNT